VTIPTCMNRVQYWESSTGNLTKWASRPGRSPLRRGGPWNLVAGAARSPLLVALRRSKVSPPALLLVGINGMGPHV
jgi:hypothetical protein